MQFQHEHNEDVTLMQQVCSGDPEASVRFVERLSEMLNRLVFRLNGWHADNQDLLQDVFVSLLHKGHSFRGTSSLETWAVSIAINRCRNWRRDRKNSYRIDEVPPRTVESGAERLETQEIVQLALESVSDADRELIVLRHMEMRSLDDIAEILGIRKNTLEVRLNRARKALEHHLRPLLRDSVK